METFKMSNAWNPLKLKIKYIRVFTFYCGVLRLTELDTCSYTLIFHRKPNWECNNFVLIFIYFWVLSHPLFLSFLYFKCCSLVLYQSVMALYIPRMSSWQKFHLINYYIVVNWLSENLTREQLYLGWSLWLTLKWNSFKLKNDTVLNSFLKKKMVEIRIRIRIGIMN